MTEIKPGRELLRIYALEDEKGEIVGVMLASNLPEDGMKEILRKAVIYLEKGEGTHIKDVRIKEPGDIKFHTEA